MTARFPDLDGASVFITGGGSGIGAALTGAFLGQGARVAFVQRSDATAFVDEMAATHGARPLFIPCDVTETDALRAAVAQAGEAHGPVTRLICCAGMDDRHTTADVTPDYWDTMMAVNLGAYFFAAQAAAPGMKTAGGGAIVNFSSASYLEGSGAYPLYVAANAGIMGLTRALAREHGPDGVRVNAVAPGWTLTARQREELATPEALDAHLAQTCLRRHIGPEDHAGPVLFLASQAAGAITGQCLPVDAGATAVG